VALVLDTGSLQTFAVSNDASPGPTLITSLMPSLLPRFVVHGIFSLRTFELPSVGEEEEWMRLEVKL
jgi:hypothetical protein